MTTDTSREAVQRLAHFHALSAERYDADEESGLKACATVTAATLRALLAERDGLGALVDRMHAQDVAAIQQWRAAHPGTDLQWPGQIRLTAWCLGEVAKVLAERDAARAECQTWLAHIRALDVQLTEAQEQRDAARAEAARMREALQRWQHYACPDCGGDCGSANPPVSCCIMQETRAALAAQDGGA